MTDSPLCRPLDVVALILLDEERLGAADVAVFVDAFLDCVVHDFAGGDGCGVVSEKTSGDKCEWGGEKVKVKGEGRKDGETYSRRGKSWFQ